jgi:hypothetical protein
MLFLRKFGLTGVHGIIGWFVVMIPAAAIVYGTLMPALRRAARSWRPAA